MLSRRVVALLLASVAVVSLSACTTGSPAGSASSSPAVTTPQADIAGEWVLTRTVVSSNDPTDPAHAVGAASVRLVLVERDSCKTALCPGTVSSGATAEARQKTALVQTDGGFGYTYSGTLNCLNVTTGGVLAVDGFDYTQKIALTVGESADVAGAKSATSLTGTLSYTSTLTDKAAAAGCTRDPAVVTVDYSVTAVRPA